MTTRRIIAAALACTVAACATMSDSTMTNPSPKTRLMLSGNDGKFPNDGAYSVSPNPVPDTLTVLDASVFPPKKLSEIPIQHTPTGPPMTIAITADEKLALVSVPNHIDPNDKTKIVNDTFMQVVDLEANPPKLIAKVELKNHPLGVSVNKAGTLALAAHQDGNVSVMSINGKDVKHVGSVKIGDPATSVRMVAITPDGKWALVGKRGTDTVAVLSIDGEKVALTKTEITVGSNPYGIDISNDGRFAAVGNAGRGEGSNDTVSVIDLTRQPFRNVQTLTVGPGVESVTISPDGRYIAVNNQNMTNVPKSNPLRTENGRVMLFEMRNGLWTKRDELPIGHNPQGLVFTPDGRYLVVQNYVEKELALFSVAGGELKDTGQRIAVPGYPSGLRIAPQ